MILSSVVALVVSIFAVTADTYPPQHGHRVVCYLGTEDFDNLRFNPADAEPALHMCTHLIYACGYLRDLNIILYGGEGVDALENVKQLVAMRTEKFRYLKIILGVGHIDFSDTPYSWMAEDPDSRSGFVQNMLKFLLDNNLDGMEIGWKFGLNGYDFITKNFNQVLLAKELRKEFDKHGLIVSMAVLSGVEGADLGIDDVGLSEHVHFMNIGSQVHSGINASLEHHMTNGVQPEKINIVLFSMGVSYEMDNQHPLNDRKKIIKKVEPSQLMGYSVLCKEMEGGGWTKVMDNDTGLVSFGNKDFLVIMDNPFSTNLKISYAMNKHLGGVGFRSLAGDDYKGECVESDGKFPMLRNIDNTLVELARNAYEDIFDSLGQNDASFFWSGGFKGPSKV